MKRLENFVRRNGLALLAALVLTIAFGAQTAQAQIRDVRPFVDCVEQEYVGGAATENYIAYFGYSNNGSSTRQFEASGPNNYFFVDPDEPAPQNEVSFFVPGVHPRVVSIVVPMGKQATWILGVGFATATFRTDSGISLCAADGANARLITYQGKLSDGAAAANGAYDLQFQLFNQPTGGTARTTKITLDNVQVTNGVFTVQLDLGANALTVGNSGVLSAAGNLKLNPAILDAENSFFEISVRAGTSTGAYTTLTTRQPLTAVPMAMRANTANNAFRAAYADNAANANNAANLGGTAANQFVKTTDGRLSDARTPTAGSSNYIQNTATQQTNSNFNISGNGAVGGNLTVTGTLNATLPANSTNYIQNSTAQQASSNFNISGNGTIGGNLVTGGTITSGCRAGFTAIAGGRLCVSEMQTAATFYGANGAVQTCTNLAARVGNSTDAMLTFSQSGFNYFSGTTSGWLADNLGDDLRATWNVSAPAPNFDGAPVNVFTTATSLPFRCVY